MKQLKNAGYKSGKMLCFILGYNYHSSDSEFHLMRASTLRVGNILQYLHTIPGTFLAHNPVNATWEAIAR